MTELKLCKDCKYFEQGYVFLFIKNQYDKKCKHPSCCNMVTGKGGSYCENQRGYNDVKSCGKEGKNFEPKS